MMLSVLVIRLIFFFSSRRRHTRCLSDWSSDVCSSDLEPTGSSARSAGWSSTARATRAVGERLNEVVLERRRDEIDHVVHAHRRERLDLDDVACERKQIGRASWRERGGRWGGRGTAKKK